MDRVFCHRGGTRRRDVLPQDDRCEQAVRLPGVCERKARNARRMIVIVGAGLAGLSTAYHLSGIPYRLYEREQEVGGLCRSYRKDGFTFDYTGHLLHFRQPDIKALVERLLPGKLHTHRRKSFIYSHKTYTEYPFQVNTHGLPPEVVRE